MPVDSYMLFKKYDGTYLKSESQVDFGSSKSDKIGEPFLSQAGNVFEVTSFSFDVEQTLNLSSQSSGAGAGKIQFNPFKVSRKIDLATSAMFQMACQGTTFQTVSLGFRKAAGIEASGLFYLRFDFKLVALKTMSWSHDDESPTEDLEFEYGALQIRYGQQNAGGSIVEQNPVGWNKIKNIADISETAIGKA
jgi:type VI secretion system secreted protein Hcp